MKLGLIADTHDHLDSRVGDLFHGVHHILHAGDVGQPAIVAELETIAPVTVVAGNNDFYPGWRDTEVRELHGHRILVEHIVHPQTPSSAFLLRLRKSEARIVVFGHTHRPFHRDLGGVLYLNPGSAGAPRHGLPATVCLLHLDGSSPRAEFLTLDNRPFLP